MTLFEKIAAREIPATILTEGEEWIAFRDIAPQAPVHFLVVPKRCIPRINEATPSDSALLGTLLSAAATTARQEGLSENGYRIVINNGADGGEMFARKETLDLIRAYYQLSERPRRRLLDLAKSLHGGIDQTDAA
jgi:histidine triad (HIT) family protein